MYKFTSPDTKSDPFTPKGPPISKDSYIPCCCEYHFNEERVCKPPPGHDNALLNIIASRPINLQVVSNPDTEIAREEEV